jgi:hypothetical protein
MKRIIEPLIIRRVILLALATVPALAAESAHFIVR